MAKENHIGRVQSLREKLDNADFHKHPSSQELVKKSGCFLLFLPPYSPDLNKIEHFWHTLKSKVRIFTKKRNEISGTMGGKNVGLDV